MGNSEEMRQRADRFEQLAEKARAGSATTKEIVSELLRQIDTSAMSTDDLAMFTALQDGDPTELGDKQSVEVCEMWAKTLRMMADSSDRGT